MLSIDWTEIALNDYHECIEYVENNFSEKKTFDFIQKMDYTINLISKNPNTFPKSEYKNIRYIVVMKPITLFYTISDKKTIQIVRVWNNRKNKSNFKIKI